MVDTTVCYRHSQRPTRLRCSECERYICAECSYDAPVGQRCPECHRQVGTTEVRRMRDLSALSGASVTRALLLLIVAGYVAQSVIPGLASPMIQTVDAIDDGQLWRLVTTAFLHGGLFHIALNGYALYILGPPIERGVGAAAFAALWVVSAIGGGVAVHTIGGYTAVVGASGALFGLFGYFLVLGWQQRSTRAGRGLLRQFGYLLLINAAAPLLFPIISWQGHLGGLLTGMAITALWARFGRAGSRPKVAAALLVGVLLIGAIVLI